MVVTIGTGMGLASIASAVAIMMLPTLDPSELEPTSERLVPIVSELSTEDVTKPEPKNRWSRFLKSLWCVWTGRVPQ